MRGYAVVGVVDAVGPDVASHLASPASVRGRSHPVDWCGALGLNVLLGTRPACIHWKPAAPLRIGSLAAALVSLMLDQYDATVPVGSRRAAS